MSSYCSSSCPTLSPTPFSTTPALTCTSLGHKACMLALAPAWPCSNRGNSLSQGQNCHRAGTVANTCSRLQAGVGLEQGVSRGLGGWGEGGPEAAGVGEVVVEGRAGMGEASGRVNRWQGRRGTRGRSQAPLLGPPLLSLQYLPYCLPLYCLFASSSAVAFCTVCPPIAPTPATACPASVGVEDEFRMTL